MSMSLVDVEINDNSSQKCLTAFVACIRGKWLFALLKHVHRAAKGKPVAQIPAMQYVIYINKSLEHMEMDRVAAGMLIQAESTHFM
ncbi:hypothetical protein O5D80_004307 [Batrachochytrium dendrobatidis]|nr:hypothetical protein O5D80_004307 [Batrachochytrium dendrobatidis]